MPVERVFALLGSLFALLAVVLGAFGGHVLQDRLDARDLQIFEVAVRYQMYHALALLFLAVLLDRNGSGVGVAAGWAFAIGVLVFSGSLYLLVLTGIRGLGAVTPIGGLALISGWALVITHVLRSG